MLEVYEYLKKSQTFFLATVDGGQARVRPFGAVSVFENKLYIQTGRVKKVYRQLIEHPHIEISAMGSDGSWIRVEATAVEDDRREARQQSLDDYPGLKGLYSADDGNHTVFYLKDATASIYTFGAEPRVIKF